MAYNIPERYSDLTPAPQLDKNDIKQKWYGCHASCRLLSTMKECRPVDGCGVFSRGLQKISYKQG